MTAVDLLIVLFVAALFAGGFIVAMRDADQLRSYCDREEQLDELWEEAA